MTCAVVSTHLHPAEEGWVSLCPPLSNQTDVSYEENPCWHG